MKKSIALLLACTALVACNKTTPEPSPQPPKPEASVVHYIAKIEHYDEATKAKVYEVSYNYDSQKRINSFVDKYYTAGGKIQEVAGRIRYEANKVHAEYDNHKNQSSLTKPTEYLVELDAATGRAKQFVETTHSAQPDSWIETDYTFNQSGKQTSYTSNKFVTKTASEWTNNNLTKIHHLRNDIESTEMREYGAYQNNVYPDLNLFLQRIVLSPDKKYLWSDLLGVKSDKLMTSYQLGTTPKNPDVDYNKTFVYELDSKGRPVRISVQKPKGETNDYYLITYVQF